MTVCIAALAEQGTKAVLIADKLATSGGVLPYQLEGAANKIIEINDNVSIMYAGSLADATAIIDEAKRTIGHRKWIKEIAEHVNDKHLEYLHSIIERRDIIGRGLKNISEFHRDKTVNIPDDVRRQIDANLANNTLSSNTLFIVCGKDHEGLFKIYQLNINPRIIPQLILGGYATIGSGGGYANFSLIQSGYRETLSEDQVKSMLQTAKKEAEKDRDVGDAEDVVILK